MLKPKALYSLALLLLLNGCQTGKPRTPQETGEMPYGKWRFAFFTPHALPAVVTRAMIIDSEKVVSSYRTLDGVHDNPNSIDSWSNRVRRHAHFNKARHPPVLMLFCWDSIIDKKTYETPVSYTHLDVYKRQIPKRPRISSKEKPTRTVNGEYNDLSLSLIPI